MALQTDTITALATPPGRGGVGIVRVSGVLALPIAKQILGHQPKPRYAHYGPFKDDQGITMDEGLGIFFPGPNSFTGEDVLELQGHGGPIVMDLLLQRVMQLGARAAKPGEFSERAFLNDKLDLAQAEAISDLIDSASTQAARCALRSLQGAFSNHIQQLVNTLIALRVYVEAAIDFPEEEVDFLADGIVQGRLEALLDQLQAVIKEANQGALLREGMNVVLAGRPNAGKSSLLNALVGKDSAIVTQIAGTTRDVLREHIHIDGMPLHIIDTAGLRDNPDEVERIGIERALKEIEQADRVLLVVDAESTQKLPPEVLFPELMSILSTENRVTLIRNKVDLTEEFPGIEMLETGHTQINVSALQGLGIDSLKTHLKAIMGYDSAGEGGFIARRRHLDALHRAKQSLVNGMEQLLTAGAGELLAEDLRAAQQALGEITGAFSSDDLLGEIFSSFCIGK
jgi:tRNA modification GTPase